MPKGYNKNQNPPCLAGLLLDPLRPAGTSPIRRTRMGEENIMYLWEFDFVENIKFPLPQLRSPIGGGPGGGQMHKRTTPKIFGHAKQLHRNMSPAEAKLWTHLRAHRMGDVHFRNQHAIGNYIVDFCASRKKLIIELDGLPSVAAPGSERV